MWKTISYLTAAVLMGTIQAKSARELGEPRQLNCPEMCALFHHPDDCPEKCANLGASTGATTKGCAATDWPCIKEYMESL